MHAKDLWSYLQLIDNTKNFECNLQICDFDFIFAYHRLMLPLS